MLVNYYGWHKVAYQLGMLRIGKLQFFIWTYPVFSITKNPREINVGWLSVKINPSER